jgi:hypothetical protein
MRIVEDAAAYPIGSGPVRRLRVRVSSEGDHFRGRYDLDPRSVVVAGGETLVVAVLVYPRRGESHQPIASGESWRSNASMDSHEAREILRALRGELALEEISGLAEIDEVPMPSPGLVVDD